MYHPLQDYPGEDILLVYDYDFKYGENFYVCITEEAKELVLNVSTINVKVTVEMLLSMLLHMSLAVVYCVPHSPQ